MLTKLLPTLLVLGFIGSCAKDKEFDEVVRTNTTLGLASAEQKSNFATEMCTLDDPCLFLPSVAQTPAEVTASRPFWQGAERLVVASMKNKGKLQFLHLEEDSRFQDNINNLSPVLNIEVKHVDYRCKEDQFGDCTNVEEIDKEKPWNQKRFVQINKVNVVETNTLPIEMGELFNSGCFSEIDQSMEKLDITKTSMNINVKKTYKAKGSCANLRTLDDFRYLTFTVDYTYSIVKLSSLADKSYSAVKYPTSDEAKFGFFKTEKKSKTVDNHDHVQGLRNSFANRWSPNRNEIPYYLSEEFYAPGMEEMLKSTHSAVETINKSLAEANSNLVVTLQKGTNSDIGDLRKNFLILVKDPQASGVIGYGPSVANPKTGEIINARTVMYFGTIQKFVSRAYDELVDDVIAEVNNQRAQEAREASEAEVSEAEAASAAGSAQDNLVVENHSTDFSQALMKNSFIDEFNINQVFQHDNNAVITDTRSAEEQGGDLLKEFKNLSLGKASTLEEKIANMAKETFYHGSQVNYDEIIKEQLLAQITKGEQVARWDSLTEEKRAEIMKTLLPYVWVPTLVHEFGHNLGLRHNFYGSTDTKNFYAKDEAQALGMNKMVPYSSIMDYAPKTNNELKVMGKYDVAALRFAYAREVELSDGKMMAIAENKTLSETALPESTTLKSYKYCSDEHVSNNPLCNRHDEGTTYEEVLDFHIEQYNKRYEKLNFRGRRYSFDSRNQELSYLQRTYSLFFDVYNFFRQYDVNATSGRYDGEAWKTNANLVDIKKASDKAFDFYMNIIEQPAYHCVEFNPEAGTVSKVAPFVEMAKGTQLESFGITFDIRYGCLILNQFVPDEEKATKAYGEFGKYLNNSLDLLARNQPGFEAEAGDQSQVDVRGIWIDKVLANEMLGMRITSPSTIGAAPGSNFLDFPLYRERALSTFNSILTDTMTKSVQLTLPNGAVTPFTVKYGFEGNHDVNKSFHGGINYFFGLNGSRTNLKSTMIRSLKRNMVTSGEEGDVESEEALESYYYFDVDRISVRADVSLKRYEKIIEFKDSKGVVKYRFGAYDYQTKAIELANMKETMDKILAKETGEAREAKVIVIAYRIITDEKVTMKEVAESGEYSEEELAEVRILLDLDPNTLVAVVAGSLTEKVLLSSLLALSK